MASGRMEFHSRRLMQHSNFSFVLPNDVEMGEVFEPAYYEREPMNLILLHGLTGTDTDWLYGGVAQEMAIQYNLNIFMPTTGNSFYLNKGYEGAECADFVGEELPEYIRGTFGIAMDKTNTLIGGLSMGGYGAIHTALTFPERFGACIGLSSALHMSEWADPVSRRQNGLLDERMLRDVFGDLDRLLETDRNPEVLVKSLKEAGTPIPKLYIACGTEDGLIESNREFSAFLAKEGVEHIYEEGPGKHNWTFWNEYINRGLAAVL